MSQIKVGDVVVLKSGGPSMTVESIDVYGGQTKAKCIWFDGPKRQDAVFALDVLTLEEEAD
jgi:uncharacterized protein YodC (DUF2158 family)